MGEDGAKFVLGALLLASGVILAAICGLLWGAVGLEWAKYPTYLGIGTAALGVLVLARLPWGTP